MRSLPAAEPDRRPLKSGLLCCALLLGACAGPAPQPTLHLLEAVPSAEPPLRVERAQGILGLVQVAVPDYVDQDAVLTRTSDGVLLRDEHHRWADDPASAISRVLADRLKRHSGSEVVVEPWPQGVEPRLRIDIRFSRLLREPSGAAEAAGQIRIIDEQRRELVALRDFQLLREVNSTSVSGYFRALAELMDDVARQAVELY